jgi:hypothetical protein
MVHVLLIFAAGVFKRFRMLSRLWEASIKVEQFVLQLEEIHEICYWEVLLDIIRSL